MGLAQDFVPPDCWVKDQKTGHNARVNLGTRIECLGRIRPARYGGWTSDAVHAYLYEDHTAQKGVSQGMLKSQLITLPSQEVYTPRPFPRKLRPTGEVMMTGPRLKGKKTKSC